MRIAALKIVEGDAPGKMYGVVEGERFRPFLREGAAVRDLRDVIASLAPGGVAFDFGPDVPLVAAPLAAPVGPLAKNVLCVGKNYRDHVQELARSGFAASRGQPDVPAYPIVFTKATNSLAGPGEPIPASSDPTDSVDYEGELAVVIGRRCRAITPAQAFEHVFGYTIVNDVSSRTVQQRHGQWFLGKSLAGFCPVGPWIVTHDEMGEPGAQRLVTTVNGEVRQSAPLADMIFDVPTLIATIAGYVTLEPGDVIATGTPAGVGMGFDPPRWLKPGDVVSVSIEGIGELTNPVT